MGNSIVPSRIHYHNNIQLDYFGKKIKKTMIPVSSRYVNRQIDEMVRFAELDFNQEIIEVGCGMGKYLLNLLERRYKMSGLDLSPFLLQKLLEYNNNKFDFDLYATDILEAPEMLNEKFDVVVGFMTLHHLHNLYASYQAMFRILKPGGRVIFLEPNPYNPLYYAQVLFTPGMSWKAEKGIADMRRKVITQAGAYAGFENLELHRFGFFPPQLSNKSWADKIEPKLENSRLLKPFLPFQLFKLHKPK